MKYYEQDFKAKLTQNNLNLRIATVYVWLLDQIYCRKKSDTYRCILSNRNRIGFYAEIHIIFGTVYRARFFWPVMGPEKES